MNDFYTQAFENNRKWLEKKKASEANFFEHLSKGQHPEMLYIGCSDSRVSAEEMIGAQPGQLFVHRNVANVVANIDLNAMSVIEYAVEYLKVKSIVVCGHYFCGGVKAAMQSEDLGLLNPWLRNIRDVYRLHQEELDNIGDDTERYNRLVELNVEEQCINIIKTAVVQRHYLNDGFPSVHGWVFDVRSGKLIDLNINFEDKLKNIQQIYNLGTKV